MLQFNKKSLTKIMVAEPMVFSVSLANAQLNVGSSAARDATIRSNKATSCLAGLLLPVLLLFFSAANGQNGYIYVHKKTLDESSSLDFTFSVSGGSTAVPNFSLNDKPDQIALRDIGSSANGRLWAVGENGRLYYRDLGSSKWVQPLPNITNAWRVDGGSGGAAYYVATNGAVYLHDGISSTTLISSTASVYALDIGSGWDNMPYIVDNYGDIYRYSGSGAVWNLFYDNPTDDFGSIDIDPSTGTVYAATNGGSTGAYKISPSGIATFIDKPSEVVDGDYFYDIGVDALGNVFCIGNSDPGANPFVFKWEGGTNWSSRELTTALSSSITGGLGGQMWTTVSLASGANIYHNIFTRALDGATNWWIDDERVRTTVSNGNSEMIAVAPGTYIITETVPGGWDLQKITVYDPSSNSSSNVNANTATVTVEANETVNVIFQNGVVNAYTMTKDCNALYIEDFGTGATGTYGAAFLGQTSYHYIGNSTPGEDGYYKIVSRAFPDFNTWSNGIFYDHTSANGTGRMLAVNAAYDKNEFFRRRFASVIPGATYNFSAWIANLTPGAAIDPNVSFQVVDPTTNTIIAQNITGDLTGSTTAWTQYTLSFVATSNVLELMLVNNNVGGGGNDLAIDDITFQMLPPSVPTTTFTDATSAGGGSITVTAPLSASYEYSIDGINYQSSPVFTNLPAGVYTVSTRFAGTAGCVSSKIDTIRLSIYGNVFNDGDAMTDGKVDGSGIGTASVPLYISLYNGATLIQTKPVNADGTYQFSGVMGSITYTAVLGTNASANPSSPFAGSGTGGWYSTGEVCCNNSGSDGVVDGKLTIAVGGTAPVNSNFGIKPMSVLPIILKEFTVQQEANGAVIKLKWTSGSESNNKGFDIERSDDGINWYKIGYQASKAPDGNSTSAISYLFTDANPLPGINYYRLKQTDFDGKTAYSIVATVNIRREKAIDLNVYPNPVSSELIITVSGVSRFLQANITVYSAVGQVVYKTTITRQTSAINCTKFQDGVYFVVYTDGAGNRMQTKVTKN